MTQQLSFIAVTLFMLSGVPVQAAGQPLAQALNTGTVCEASDGFLRSTPGHESQTRELVESVNADRATVYAEIARKDGLDPSIVGVEHAKEIRSKNPNWACR